MDSVNFHALFKKKMTRREFLMYLGVLIVALSGIAGFLQTIAHPQIRSKPAKTAKRFGSGAYGV